MPFLVLAPSFASQLSPDLARKVVHGEMELGRAHVQHKTPGGVTWQWQGEDGHWTKYAIASDNIEKCYQTYLGGHSSIVYLTLTKPDSDRNTSKASAGSDRNTSKASGDLYQLDFAAMEQQNSSSRCKSKIRRLLLSDITPPTDTASAPDFIEPGTFSGTWQWRADDNKWVTYTPDVNVQIENHRQNHPPQSPLILKVEGMTGNASNEYQLDFTRMLQIDMRSKHQRPIKFVPSLESHLEAKCGFQAPNIYSLPLNDGEQYSPLSANEHGQFMLLGFEEDLADALVALKAAIDERRQQLALDVCAETLPTEQKIELQAQLTALAQEYDSRLKPQL